MFLMKDSITVHQEKISELFWRMQVKKYEKITQQHVLRGGFSPIFSSNSFFPSLRTPELRIDLWVIAITMLSKASWTPSPNLAEVS